MISVENGVPTLHTYKFKRISAKRIPDVSKSNIILIQNAFQRELCGYVLLVMGVYWATEAIPMAMTALLPIVFLPVMGILSVKDIAAIFVKVCLNKVSKTDLYNSHLK